MSINVADPFALRDKMTKNLVDRRHGAIEDLGPSLRPLPFVWDVSELLVDGKPQPEAGASASAAEPAKMRTIIHEIVSIYIVGSSLGQPECIL